MMGNLFMGQAGWTWGEYECCYFSTILSPGGQNKENGGMKKLKNDWFFEGFQNLWVAGTHREIGVGCLNQGWQGVNLLPCSHPGRYQRIPPGNGGPSGRFH